MWLAGTYSNSKSLSWTSWPLWSVWINGGWSKCEYWQIGYIPNSSGTGWTIWGVGTYALIGDGSCVTRRNYPPIPLEGILFMNSQLVKTIPFPIKNI